MSITAESRISPFDQVVALESEQDQRVRDALALLEEERIAEASSLALTQRMSIEQATAAARADVARFEADEVPKLKDISEQHASEEVKHIEREAAARVKSAATAVVNYALSSSFSLAL